MSLHIPVIDQDVTFSLDSDQLPGPLNPKNMPYALNSSDHYFNPSTPSVVAAYGVGVKPVELLRNYAAGVAKALVSVTPALRDLPEDVRSQVEALLKQKMFELLDADPQIFTAKRRTYDQLLSDSEGSLPSPASDGDGYNALSATLFLLNGRNLSADTTSNPCGAAPDQGFVQLARGNDLNRAMISLGASLHYVEDLYSPGHTVWFSWLMTVVDASAHTAFDKLGDSYFSDEPCPYIIADNPDKKKLQKQHLQSLVQRASPISILSFSGTPKPCEQQSGKSVSLPSSIFETDLPKELMRVAHASTALWGRHSRFIACVMAALAIASSAAMR